MIELPKEIKEKYDLDVVLFNVGIEYLRAQAALSKKRLLTESFDQFPTEGNLDDKINFVLQFTEIIQILVLFPDDEVIGKLKSLKFSNLILKWFIPIDEILKELERLTKIDRLFFFLNPYFFAVQSHLQMKVLIALIEGFAININYNNCDTNIVFKDFADRQRRRDYNKSKGQTPKMDSFEKAMNGLNNILERQANDEVLVKKYLLQLTKGNTSGFYLLIDDFIYAGKSRNRAYKELFPLLKMVLLDHELLSEDEFGALSNEASSYDGNYSKYKTERVKKILRKK
jgi:hypothetical protein